MSVTYEDIAAAHERIKPHAVRTPVLMDTTKARRQLGWGPRHSALETLQAMVDGARGERLIR